MQLSRIHTLTIVKPTTHVQRVDFICKKTTRIKVIEFSEVII